MKSPATRRTVLVTAAAVALAAATPTPAAETTVLPGVITFGDGRAIPEGNILIYIENPAIQDRAQRRIAETQVSSSGESRMIDFSVMPPSNATTSPQLRIVVRLERHDGWLIARGSAQITSALPVSVSLNEVIY